MNVYLALNALAGGLVHFFISRVLDGILESMQDFLDLM
jgi:hypothetical protein